MMLHHGTTHHPHRSVWLRGCLSLAALLLLIGLGAALAAREIRAGRMAPPQGIVRLGPATLNASVSDCPSFPRCIALAYWGDTTPPPDRLPVQYTVVLYLTGPNGPAAYRLFDMWLEGTVVGQIMMDH